MHLYELMGYAIALAGAVMLLAGAAHTLHKKRHCTAEVDAVCIKMHKRTGQNGRGVQTILFAPEWEYRYQNQKYRKTSGWLKRELLPVRTGDHYTLYIDPERPEDLDFRPDRIRTNMLTGSGAFLLLFGGLLLTAFYMGW